MKHTRPQPLNSKKKSTEGSFDKENCLYSNSDILSSACDQQTYVNIVGGIPEKRPNDYMSLDDTRESSSPSIYTTLTSPMEWCNFWLGILEHGNCQQDFLNNQC